MEDDNNSLGRITQKSIKLVRTHIYASRPVAVSVNEIHKATGVHKNSIKRILEMLQSEELIGPVSTRGTVLYRWKKENNH